MPRIQVAGIKSQKELEMLISLGVDDLAFPVGPGVREEDLPSDQVGFLIERLSPAHRGTVITYLTQPRDILTLVQDTHASWIQLHGKVLVSEVAELRRLAPQLKLIKTIAIGNSEPENWQNFEPLVDSFLLDTSDPQTGSWGATGKTHDWSISRQITESSRLPVILAGGLDSTNVEEAIKKVRPFAVDAHTRLEDPAGNKDPAKVKAFVENAKIAFTQLG